MGNIVAIVGRPNVGKSTLFNRLVGMRQAIVDATEGTTRDRHYGTTDWNGREFTVIDTGGFTVNSEDVFEQAICRQVKLAIEEADELIFMVDVETGITDLDLRMADMLRRQDKPVHLTVNKVDNTMRQTEAYEFYSLGLGDPITISSMTGSGTGELLDAVVASLPPETDTETAADEEETKVPKIAIVGRPNVGKSSLTNALLGEERNIVTPIAGTTRDAIHTYYNKYGMEFHLVDTAGLRKKQKVTDDLEFYSVMRTIRAIEDCDTAILMLDASQGVDAQDMNIFHLIVKNRKGCVIAVNKWDTVPDKQSNTMKEYTEQIRQRLAPFDDVPIVFTSVTEKQRIFDVLKTALRVCENRKRRIPTAVLNEFILPIIEQTPPPSIKGKYIRIKYAMMLPTPTPQFAFFVNLPQYVKDSYRRFLENRIRGEWDFTGVPMQIYFRQK
ncbi:ribosome biogenesis GTPase Der [uncultured Rikenella sp.]|uniref:ribosome biogenesis GTPase Der n=1 Tax=uncultured Rikenella sp. TaxID=368003 RepID=UPI0027295CBB|nr:ribosome biogenesis GTPase Der [uncultured Rikenella sp.]